MDIEDADTKLIDGYDYVKLADAEAAIEAERDRWGKRMRTASRNLERLERGIRRIAARRENMSPPDILAACADALGLDAKDLEGGS